MPGRCIAAAEAGGGGGTVTKWMVPSLKVERDAFIGLAFALYADHYSRLGADAGAPSDVDKTAFLSELRAANPVTPRQQDGWTVTRLDAGGV